MANDTIKAIPTRYKGYHFRSRLEARWAVFFDQLGFNWAYEQEGFELPSGAKYLPDFKIVNEGVAWYYEVKPNTTTGDQKFDEFAQYVRRDRATGATLLCGDPLDVFQSGAKPCPRCGNFGPDVEFSRLERLAGTHNEVQITCYPCDAVTPVGSGNDLESGALAPSMPSKGSLYLSSAWYAKAVGIVIAAANAARSARFEFGESGAS